METDSIILVFNSGSTSLKFGCFGPGLETVASGDIDWANGDRNAAELQVVSADGSLKQSQVSVPDDLSAARCALEAVREVCGRDVVAVGHRVVHGGAEFQTTSLITPAVREAIRRLCKLAPLHNPPALSTLEAIEGMMPGVPQVAVFDTAFFRALPEAAAIYPVPYEWHERFGIRRFGFHGLSHQYCAGRAAEMMMRPLTDLRLVSCHLGGGCSAAAIKGGIPVASTMGFSPLEGLVMGTRSGSVDPGLLLHLQIERGLSAHELSEALNRKSGLLGISGISQDYSELESARAAGHARAALALDLFNNRVRSAIASLASEMEGLDAVIFTDRIGEGSSFMRHEVCSKLRFMGLTLDDKVNAIAVPDADVAAPDSSVRALVIHTREEVVVARETWRVLHSSATLR